MMKVIGLVGGTSWSSTLDSSEGAKPLLLIPAVFKLLGFVVCRIEPALNKRANCCAICL